MREQPPINIIDSMTGSGKTTKMIELINEAPQEERFIFITPFLDEVDRIKKSVINRKMYAPANLGDGKLEYFKNMIVKQQNIVSTHALFRTADEDLIDLIASNNYTLILDEVMNVVEQVNIQKDDLSLLMENEILTVREDGLAMWNDDKQFKQTTFSYIRDIARSKNMFIHNNTALMWTFPAKCFRAFNKVYVLTYMFDAQIQKYYYDIYDLKYDYYAVDKVNGKYEILPHHKVKENRARFKDLINVYEGKLNIIGEKDYSLSSTWLKNANGSKTANIKQLQRNICNYFVNIVKGNSKSNLWTTLKHSKNKLKGKGYTKGFVEHNCRATNQYSHKTNLVYAMDKYMMPIVKSFLEDKGAEINQDDWATSELIQWIWRSAIRNGEEINIYIPSKRMRSLFLSWVSEDK